MPTDETMARLEYLRGELRAERVSYGELVELQSLAEHIAPDDLELREAAGIPEHDPQDGEICAGTGNHDGQSVESCDECAEHGPWEASS